MPCRDIKPENLLLSGDPTQPQDLHLRIIDFGSALDAFSLHNLYGAGGPSNEQLTLEYAPPEVLFGRCVGSGVLGLRGHNNLSG